MTNKKVDTAEKETESGSTSASQTLNRAIQLLQLVSGSRTAGLALSDLVRSAGLTKPTTRRLLISLIENGLIEQDAESRRYFVGPETYTLGVLASERFGVHRLAAECLVRMAEITGDAALLSVQRGNETVCLAREEGSFPLRSHVLQAGDRHPLGVGAAGIAMLALLSDEEIDTVLATNADRLQAHYVSQSPDLLRRQVTETRRNGFALNAGHVFKGSWGVSVAFHDARSNTLGALTIAGVESRFTGSRIEELVALLNTEKTMLELRLKRSGYPPQTEAPPRAARIARSSRRTPVHQGNKHHV
jgi:DNA-binding IclR family transcriptional regulator